MDSGQLIVAAHLTSLFPSAQITAFPLPTSRRDAPLPPPPDPNQTPVEHAIFSTTTHVPTIGTIVLRVIHQGLILELLALSADMTPLRFSFPSPIAPQPGIFFWQSSEIHILAVTYTGSLYHLVLPVYQGRLWFDSRRASNWCHEYLIQRLSDPVEGLVHVQGPLCVILSFPNGSLLRLDAESLANEWSQDQWTETVFQHTSFLQTLASFVPVLAPVSTAGNEILSIASHPQPTDVGYIWTLSRDRNLRMWSPKSGCIASTALATSLAREATPVPGSPVGIKPQILFEGDQQTLLRAFSTNIATEQLYVLAFIPTPSSASAGGFFQFFKIEDNRFYEIARIDCSNESTHCHLQDFIVTGDLLYVLWDRKGQSMVERTWLNLEGFNLSETGYTWRQASYPQETELTPAYLDELLFWPGSMTEKFYEALMRPGMFSAFTLRTALDQYADACLQIDNKLPALLRTNYATVGENIVAAVGCTVNLLSDPHSGALQHDKYWNALKRDWEGFIARCREVERSARWPLALAMDETRGVLIIERERIGCLALNDEPLRLQKRLEADQMLNSGPSVLIEILWGLRAKLGREAMLLLERQVVSIGHEDVSFALSDILKHAAAQINLKGYLEEGMEDWTNGRLQSIGNLQTAIRSTVDVLGAFDNVKEEMVEDVDLSTGTVPSPPPHLEWSKALISGYVSASIHARYELALTLIILLFFRTEELQRWSPSLLEEVFAVFRGIAMVRFAARQPAGSSTRPSGTDATDEVIARMGNMHVTPYDRSPFVPSLSLIHLMLGSCMHGCGIAQTAHSFLDQTGLLQLVSPSHATAKEVEFCNEVAQLGYDEVAWQLLEWLPRTVGVSYLQAQLFLRAGRADDAAHLLEKLAVRFGEYGGLWSEDQQALKALVDAESRFTFYKNTGLFMFRNPWVQYRVRFCQMALSIASPDEDVSDVWNALIDGYIDLNQFEDAYSALITAPASLSKADRVLRLVYRMCEENQVEKLMSFNFAGFADEVQDALGFRACHMDPRSRPFYSRILYSWYISRGDYRNAALTMYQRARRLQQPNGDSLDFVSQAEEQLEAMMVAINALSLVDRQSAWIAVPVLKETEIVGHESKRRKLSQHIPESNYGSGKGDAEVVGLADLQYEYAMLTARVDLAKSDKTFASAGQPLLAPDLIIQRLMQSNRFDCALATARTLNVDMSELFAYLTEQCMKLSRAPRSGLQLDASDWLLSERVSSWPGSPADKGWRYLRQSLERHDNAETDYRYSKVTLESILTIDRTWPPPQWLIGTLEKYHHEYLIRVSLQAGLIQAALEHTLSLLRKTDDKLGREPSNSAGSTWLPYTLIDQVVVAANGNDLPAPTRALRTQLQEHLKTRVKRMEKLSEFHR